MKKFPRVIGTSSSIINTPLKMIYRLITKGKIDTVDCLTAEVVKTAENALRDVKIAFSNEVALLCEEINSDVWKVRELVNNRTGQNDMLMPGLGVGGHCLPKDPWLLLSSTKHLKTKLIREARNTNDYMPMHTAKLIKDMFIKNKVNPKKAKVVVLGYSYIENCEDTRNSPSVDLINILKKTGTGKVLVHDPNVAAFNNNLYELARSSHCIVLTVKHNQFKNLDLKKLKKVMKTPLIFDCKNFLKKEKCQDLDFKYYALGAL